LILVGGSPRVGWSATIDNWRRLMIDNSGDQILMLVIDELND
jgi:hypothetical protein